MDGSPSSRLRSFLVGMRPAAGLVALVAALAGVLSGLLMWHNSRVLVADREILIEGFPEISGIAWCQERRTLIAVSDEVGIAEISLEGRVLRLLELDLDLEDVVVQNGSRAWILEERTPTLIELDLETFTIVQDHPLPRLRPPGRRDINRGFEGLARDPVRNEFILLNEGKPAALIRHSLTEGTSEEVRVLDTQHANACLAPNDRKMIILSRRRGLRLLETGPGARSHPWVALRRKRAEGMTLVPGTGLFVALDTKPSRLLVFRDLDSLEALTRTLRGDRGSD